MKQYFISINSRKELATIEMRCGKYYVLESVNFKSREYFPIRKVLKAYLRIQLMKIKAIDFSHLWERYWTSNLIGRAKTKINHKLKTGGRLWKALR